MSGFAVPPEPKAEEKQKREVEREYDLFPICKVSVDTRRRSSPRHDWSPPRQSSAPLDLLATIPPWTENHISLFADWGEGHFRCAPEETYLFLKRHL
jgi:hypothetical protein